MDRVGILKRSAALLVAALVVVPSFGTAWTARAPLHTTVIDPSLSAGEVAVVRTTPGRAGALSLTLRDLGAVDVHTADAADLVIARLSPDALAAVRSSADVMLATRDTLVVATESGGSSNTGSSSGSGSANRSGRRGTSATSDNVALLSVNGPQAWGESTGKGVTVALMDSGVAEHPDLPRGKVTTRVNFVNDGATSLDPAGHGTHIAGLIAANGATFKGVAPDAKLVSLRVLDANGHGRLSDVAKAFDWLLRNARRYDVGVLNISWGAPQAMTYHRDLLAAMVESVWFAGVTVVVAAGNGGAGRGTVTMPAADPFVVTVGSFDDQGTASLSDDAESSFSSRGSTLDGFAKPDVLAPGRHVLSLRANGAANDLATMALATATSASAQSAYIHMSGTSASAGFVSGVAALLRAEHRSWSPSHVKAAITTTGRAVAGASARALDAMASLAGRGSANAGLRPSHLLVYALRRSGVKLHGVMWEGVTWEGVTWEESYDDIDWGGITWEGITWDAVTWEKVRWDSVSWETVSWEAVSWETVSWEGVAWEKLTAD
jgi:serine protease AprX